MYTVLQQMSIPLCLFFYWCVTFDIVDRPENRLANSGKQHGGLYKCYGDYIVLYISYLFHLSFKLGAD